MRYATLAALVATSMITTGALAQDGTGHGPPKAKVIITQPGPVIPMGQALTKFFKPGSTLAAMLK